LSKDTQFLLGIFMGARPALIKTTINTSSHGYKLICRKKI
jgi:hypothetical protein